MASSTPSTQPPKKFTVGGFAHVICGKGYRGQLIESLKCTRADIDKPFRIVGVDEQAKKIELVYMDKFGHAARKKVSMKMFTPEPNGTDKSSSAKSDAGSGDAKKVQAGTATETTLVGAGGLAACF